jgi:ABC-type Na+ efflux pump permease subunit
MTRTLIAPNATKTAQPAYTPPGALRTTWLIARRAAIESLRDRNTALTNIIMVVVLPALVALDLVLPGAAHAITFGQQQGLGVQLAIYLLAVGIFPSGGSVGIAAGVFAGEKEQGNLTPLLASPATNAAIFGGKVLGAILPPMLYATLAEIGFIVEVRLFAGAHTLALVPWPVFAALFALVPCYAALGASIASLISSRVRTYSAAQTFSGLILLPVLGSIFAVVIRLLEEPAWMLGIAVAAIALIDIALILIGAGTWRREEVLAKQ